MLNTLLVVVQLFIGLSFVVFMYSACFHTAGILEWTLTYLGAFWLLSFVGYTRCVVPLDLYERMLTPLLQN